MSVEISCNTKGVEEFQAAMESFDSKMKQNVHSQLTRWGLETENSARQLVPVRTGFLQSTIYARVQAWCAVIGAEASYALSVEFGSRYARAHPYLCPAVERHAPFLEQILCEAVDSAKLEAGL